LPVQVCSGDGEPLPATRARIVRVNDLTLVTHEGFNLELLDHAGGLCEFTSYETLEIALDQAHEILGVDRSEWLPADRTTP
jgi:hypothetical protein